MRTLLKRLDTLCHPFPGIHVLGVATSALLITVVMLWPETSESETNAPGLPIPAIAKTVAKTILNNAPAFRVETETVQTGDSLSRLFSRQGLSAQQLLEVTRAETKALKLSRLNVGQTLEFRYDGEALKELAVIKTPFEQLVAVQDSEGQWQLEERVKEANIYIEHARARIDSSLFLAGARAGLPDNMIMELANIYGHVIDFVYEIRQGDEFIVTYEKRYLDGEFIEYGNIIAAEFINDGERYVAIRYTDMAGDTGYYDEAGVSLRKAFLRAPLNFRRISSNFKLARKHPVLGLMRAHKGTDYAASTGTPVYAAGDGKVTYRARNGGYGKLVVIKHGNNIETRYAHLSRYGKYRVGSKVKQGQVIGYVGATGLATGPHLHYEFVVNGSHRNPRTVLDKLPKAKTLASDELARYRAVAEPLIASLEAQRTHAELALQTTAR